MKNAATRTPHSARLRCEFMINVKQKFKELDVLQEGVAHWDGLSSS
jgi:hypothetical protein